MAPATQREESQYGRVGPDARATARQPSLCLAESPRPCRGGRQFASPARVTTRHPPRDPSPHRERERKVTHQGYGPPPGGRGEKVGNPPPYATKPTHLLNVCGLFEVYQVGHFFSSMADAQGERDRELQGSGGRPPHPPPEPEAKPFPKRPAQPQIPNRRGRKFYQPPGGPTNSHAGSLSASGKGGMVSRPEKASFTGRGEEAEHLYLSAHRPPLICMSGG